MQSHYKEIKFWVYKGRKTRAPKNSWKNISFVNFRHRELDKKEFNFFFFRNRLTVNISFASRCRWRSTTDFRFRTPEATTEGETQKKRPFSFLYSFFLPYCCKLFSILFIIFFPDSRQELNFFFIAGHNAASECSFIGFIVIISSFLMEMLSFMMSGSESNVHLKGHTFD